MSKQTATQRIAELEKKLASLEAKLPEPEPESEPWFDASSTPVEGTDDVRYELKAFGLKLGVTF